MKQSIIFYALLVVILLLCSHFIYSSDMRFTVIVITAAVFVLIAGGIYANLQDNKENGERSLRFRELDLEKEKQMTAHWKLKDIIDVQEKEIKKLKKQLDDRDKKPEGGGGQGESSKI